MNSVVIDAGIAAKWLVGGKHSEQAHVILGSHRTEALTLLAPDFLATEVTQVLWKLQRFGGLKPQFARDALEEFFTIDITFTPARDLLPDALALAIQHERSVYDSLYLALSMREQCPFVTADEKLYNAVGRKFPSMMLLANWS